MILGQPLGSLSHSQLGLRKPGTTPLSHPAMPPRINPSSCVCWARIRRFSRHAAHPMRRRSPMLIMASSRHLAKALSVAMPHTIQAPIPLGAALVHNLLAASLAQDMLANTIMCTRNFCIKWPDALYKRCLAYKAADGMRTTSLYCNYSFLCPQSTWTWAPSTSRHPPASTASMRARFTHATVGRNCGSSNPQGWIRAHVHLPRRRPSPATRLATSSRVPVIQLYSATEFAKRTASMSTAASMLAPCIVQGIPNVFHAPSKPHRRDATYLHAANDGVKTPREACAPCPRDARVWASTGCQAPVFLMRHVAGAHPKISCTAVANGFEYPPPIGGSLNQDIQVLRASRLTRHALCDMKRMPPSTPFSSTKADRTPLRLPDPNTMKQTWYVARTTAE